MKKTILILMLAVFAAMMLPAASEASIVFTIPAESGRAFGVSTPYFLYYEALVPSPGSIDGNSITYFNAQILRDDAVPSAQHWMTVLTSGPSYFFDIPDQRPIGWVKDGLWHDTDITVDHLAARGLTAGELALTGTFDASARYSGGFNYWNVYPSNFTLTGSLTGDDGGEVPEPATIAGLLIAAAGIAARRLRRK